MKKYILALGLLTGSLGYAQSVNYEIFAAVGQAVGNIAFTRQGDLVYSHHPFFNPSVRVVKYNARTKATVPFPNKEWNTREKRIIIT